MRMEEKSIEHGEIGVKLSCVDNHGVIEVSDNGGGIDVNIIDAIFNPYVTTKSDSYGTGIGLYIAKNIIETRMKGSISVKNIASGASFTITLPLVVE